MNLSGSDVHILQMHSYGGEAAEGLEPAGKVVGGHEVCEVRSQLVVVVVVETFDGGFLDCAVHSFDLAVGPGVVGLSQPVLNPICFTDHVEAHRTGVDGVPVPRLLCELNAPRHCLSDQWRSNSSIGENGVNVVGPVL